MDKNVKVRFDDQYQPVSRGILLEAGRVKRLSINSTAFEVRVSGKSVEEQGAITSICSSG